MSHQKDRMYRVSFIKSAIEVAMRTGRIVDEEKFISECCLNFGSGRRYVREYLKDLEEVNFIVRKDGQIWTPAALEAEQILKRANIVPEVKVQEVKQ